MKAIIMAGGKGTRLRPLTCHIPKPMVPLLNRPCMEYIIDLLRKHGITQIGVTMQYMPEVIRNYFGDGSDFGVELHYFEEESPLGTAGSVKNAAAFLDERFLVISGDALTDFDLSRIVESHVRREALATVVLTRVERPLEYGVVMTDEAGRIVRFLEKPDWSEVFSDTVNTGIYVLEPEALQGIEEGKEQDFSNDLFPLMMKRGQPLYGYVSEGYWSDIGNMEQYRQAQFDMLDSRVEATIRGEERMPGIYVGRNVTLPSGSRDWQGPAYIGEDTVIEETAHIGPYCVIGAGNRVARGSELSRTIMWDGNRIGENNEIAGATLCSRIRSYPESVISDEAVVGCHCTIGPKTHVLPRVKIWPHKRLREYATVNASVIWGESAAKPLFAEGTVSGCANEELTPEFAARFAGAYGASLAKGKRLAVSSSGHGFARLIRSVIGPALQAVGVNVTDAGESSSAVARFGVSAMADVDGGIHVQCYQSGGRTVCRLECMDASGLPIGKSAERKVDNAFALEDYGRIEASGIVEARSVKGIVSSYGSKLIAELGYKGRRPLRLVVATEDPVLRRLLGFMAEAFRWTVIPLDPALPDSSLETAVAEQRADFGVRFGPSGETLRLFDETGAPVPQERIDVLLYVSYFQCLRGRTTGVPLSAPSFLDSAAEALGHTVVRTKRSARAVLEASTAHPFHPVHDALFGIGLLARNLIENELTVTGLLRFMPAFSLHSTFVEVPWDEKGKLMRLLTEHVKHRRADLLDGVKVYDEAGWVLLLPDTGEPRFTVIAHGERKEAALELAERYRQQLIRHFQ
ncbi:sugar phosphate nucleotidyltransferase [Paenibacillus hodogayensis]|uniref:Sugar phosphate nucleotidyltransferase n=1 Tax=Paenibacillus hodogayensis TaxID=279208 RepID=A0ABV5VRF5_9BACL